LNKFYYMDPKAPKATRLHIGAVVALFYGDTVLLDHRHDGCWGLIGGALEIGEAIEDCAKREVYEETGFNVKNLRFLGVFSNPSRKIEFESGETVQSITVCFSVDVPHQHLKLSSESKEARFYTQDELELLHIVQTHRMIVQYLFYPESWPVIL